MLFVQPCCVWACDADGVIWRGDYVFCKFIHSDCSKVGDEKYVIGKHSFDESQHWSMAVIESMMFSLEWIHFFWIRRKYSRIDWKGRWQFASLKTRGLFSCNLFDDLVSQKTKINRVWSYQSIFNIIINIEHHYYQETSSIM